MSKFKIPAALLVGVMSLGAPATAAPLTPSSVAAKPMAQDNDLVQVRYGGWHGGWGGGWHGGRGFPAGAFAGALIGGALIGGAIAAPYYGGGYYPYYGYGDDYGYAALPYGYPAYSYGYASRPGFYRGCYPHCGWGG